jgi:hypothetical protein
LEADEGADGFEDGGFALGIGADEDDAFRWCFEGEGVEAAEVEKAEVVEHGWLLERVL